ncbi:hypothetical protein [Prauserella cavernicola]|uniref:Uncharacterized protein n=1 Tax=Prauserella cavernicola TaxID=2800127 RepID=A0A934V3A4_9PSEU|nr:hypothetical protein [Prauserella cavernicola]MBK1784107.1 hypothetical protein [Prauserella cavernicola]
MRRKRSREDEPLAGCIAVTGTVAALMWTTAFVFSHTWYHGVIAATWVLIAAGWWVKSARQRKHESAPVRDPNGETTKGGTAEAAPPFTD